MTKRVFAAISFGVLTLGGTLPVLAQESVELGDITVTGMREETLRAETAETSDAVSAQEIDAVKPGHPAEVLGRVPGVHVNVTNGEGHMTAIRQPLTTGAVYLYLEDGIPLRSTGFFNHNALYEVNIPQAGGIEVTKGPGTVLYGSDAIGGVVNVMTRPAPLEREAEVNLEAGEHGWARTLISGGNSWDDDGLRADLNLTHTDGWRDGTEYDRQSGTVRWDRFLADAASLKTVLAVSNIDQQTAGTSSLSEDDYLNNPTKNTTPISYRDVQAVRFSMAYEKESADSLLSITPYVRQNYMDYMPNWSFTYDPSIKETKNDSFGLLLKYRRDFAPYRTRLVVGADIDHSPGSRLEHSIDATRTGDIYTAYTVEEVIYDYDVTYQGLSPYLHLETSPSERLRLMAGLRYDSMSYDFSNNLTQTPVVVDPISMFSNATYNQLADEKVDFSHLSPKLGATYAFSSQLNGFASYRHAFRVPSEGQLFRPGTTANTNELEAVKVDSYEVGVRGKPREALNYEVSVYYMTKTDDIVTYDDGTTRETQNAGETLHQGLELGMGVQASQMLRFDVAYSYSKHTYEQWSPKVGVSYDGNEISSAPRQIANLRMTLTPAVLQSGRLELEWEHLGKYWTDDANEHEYEGHDLLNLRANYPVSKQFEVYGRVMNLTDERYAVRASYNAFRGEEFAPGMPRTAYLGINYRF